MSEGTRNLQVFRENLNMPEIGGRTRESSVDSIGTMSFSSESYAEGGRQLNPEQVALINAFSNLDFRAVEEVIRNMPHLNGPPPISDEDLAKFEDVVADRELITKLEGDKCAICQDQIRENDRLKMLKCGHAFHSPCIVPWLKRRCTCPVCREVQGNPRQPQSISAVLQLEDQIARFEIESDDFIRQRGPNGGAVPNRANRDPLDASRRAAPFPLRSVSEDDDRDSPARISGYRLSDRVSDNSRRPVQNPLSNGRRGFASLLQDHIANSQAGLFSLVAGDSSDDEDGDVLTPDSMDTSFFSNATGTTAHSRTTLISSVIYPLNARGTLNRSERHLNVNQSNLNALSNRLRHQRRGSNPERRRSNQSSQRSTLVSRRRASHSSRTSVQRRPNRISPPRHHSSSPPSSRYIPTSRKPNRMPQSRQENRIHDPGAMSVNTPRTLSTPVSSGIDLPNDLDFRSMPTTQLHELVLQQMEAIRRSTELMTRAQEELYHRARQRDTMMCPRCKIRPPANLLSPCRHLGLCANCQLLHGSSEGDRCPICDHEVNRQIYINCT